VDVGGTERTTQSVGDSVTSAGRIDSTKEELASVGDIGFAGSGEVTVSTTVLLVALVIST